METSPFRLLHPDLVPQRREVVAPAASMLVQMGLDDTLMSASPVHRRLARVVLASSDVIDWAPARGYGLNEPTSCDRHFSVARVGGDRGAVFLSGLLLSYLDVLDNVARMGTSLPEEDWRTLMWAPTALFDHLLRRPPAGTTIMIPPALGGESLPLERWQTAHRLYFAVLQAARFGVGGLLRAASDGESSQVIELAGLATTMLRAATVALALAADVTPRLMPGTIALRMETPDHRYVWRMFDQVRAVVPRLQFEQFAQALRALCAVQQSSALLATGG